MMYINLDSIRIHICFTRAIVLRSKLEDHKLFAIIWHRPTSLFPLLVSTS